MPEGKNNYLFSLENYTIKSLGEKYIDKQILMYNTEINSIVKFYKNIQQTQRVARKRA